MFGLENLLDKMISIERYFASDICRTYFLLGFSPQVDAVFVTCLTLHSCSTFWLRSAGTPNPLNSLISLSI